MLHILDSVGLARVYETCVVHVNGLVSASSLLYLHGFVIHTKMTFTHENINSSRCFQIHTVCIGVSVWMEGVRSSVVSVRVLD